MNETPIIIFLSLLVTVGGTLGGIWLGHRLERSNEMRNWRRERCLEAYTKVFTSCDVVVSEANKAYYDTDEFASLAHNKQCEVVLEKVAEMYRTVDQTVLVGSQEVYEKLQHLTVYCGKNIGEKSIIFPKLSKGEWNKISVIDFATLFQDCRNAARNDLKNFF